MVVPWRVLTEEGTGHEPEKRTLEPPAALP